MAVYTHVSADQVQDLIRPLRVKSLTPIPQGVENSNYDLQTDQGHFVLTLFERRVNPDDVPFFLDFMAHLAGKTIPCPEIRLGPIALAGKTAILQEFLEGTSIAPNPENCAVIGALCARMHKAAEDFTQTRPNTMGLAAWKDLFAKISTHLDAAQNALIAGELAWLEQNWPHDLPEGAVHADLFPDNVLFSPDGQVSGVIDFYFSCTDFYVYDLALTLNAWGLEKGGDIKAFMQAYESVRPLIDAEKAALNMMGRAASLRILMTRLHDKIFHDPQALVTPKDPQAYLDRLLYYREQGA